MGLCPCTQLPPPLSSSDCDPARYRNRWQDRSPIHSVTATVSSSDCDPARYRTAFVDATWADAETVDARARSRERRLARRSARAADAMAPTARDLRELDERPVPRARRRGLRAARVRHHGVDRASHVPGTDEAAGARSRADGRPRVAGERLARRLDREQSLY